MDPMTITTETPTAATPDLTTAHTPADPALRRTILARIAKRTFCTLATNSPGGFPHVAGVVYEALDALDAGAQAPDLWIHTTRSSRKARSIAANGRVAVCIPFRRLPVGPPYTIHFQATAEVIDMDDHRVRHLLDQGKLGSISGHGALDMPDGCFVRICPRGTIHSFGPGARVVDLIRDPIGSGGRSFRLDTP